MGWASRFSGTRETVKKFNARHRCSTIINRVYSPKNILITAAGNLEHEHIVRLIRERFDDLQERGALARGSASRRHRRPSS